MFTLRLVMALVSPFRCASHHIFLFVFYCFERTREGNKQRKIWCGATLERFEICVSLCFILQISNLSVIAFIFLLATPFFSNANKNIKAMR